jgi:hypothetical protein
MAAWRKRCARCSSPRDSIALLMRATVARTAGPKSRDNVASDARREIMFGMGSGTCPSDRVHAEDPLFVLVSSEPAEQEHADRGEAGGDDQRQQATTGPVEIAERTRTSGQRDEHEPRQDHDRARVDPHLQTFGFESIQQLEVAGRAIDEIFENVPHDRTAALVRKQEHLEHAVAGRVRELFLHQLQRGPGTEHARQFGKARKRLAQRGRTRDRERDHGLRQRTPCRDRRDDITEPVGPRGLDLAHP